MQKNKYKLIEKKMNKLKFFSVAFFASFTLVNAQDIDQAKKAIDAEQFEKAKTILKSLLQAKPSNGTASFLLGNVYMSQKELDSAKIYYQKGITGSDGAKLNYIGLGQLDLNYDLNTYFLSFKNKTNNTLEIKIYTENENFFARTPGSDTTASWDIVFKLKTNQNNFGGGFRE